MANPPLNFDELENVFAEMERLESTGYGIGITGELAPRARALEYGSVAGQKPWPRLGERTVLAVDPETGAQVVVSAQAPQGFIRIHEPEFVAQLRSELSEVAGWLDAEQVQEHLVQATREAAGSALQTIRQSVPRDSGELASNLHIVK